MTHYHLLGIHDMIYNLHYPQNFVKLQEAKHRLYTERLLKMQLISQLNKVDYYNHITIKQTTDPDWSIIKDIVSKLPFVLTIAQKKVIKQ